MSAHNINGGELRKWSKASIAFGDDLLGMANGDPEIANMIVQVAMNIVGNAAFRNDCDVEEVIDRVLPTAYWQLEQLKDAARDAAEKAKARKRIN